MPPLIDPSCFNRNDEDWRWTLTGIDGGQGYDAPYPLHAFDGDLETYHRTWGPRRDVDSFTIVLSSPASFDRIQAITGMPNGDHRLRLGVLEVSTGYGQWQEVARFKNGVADAALDDRRVVALRIRSTINQPPNAVMAIREFMLWKNGKSTLRELSAVERLRIPRPRFPAQAGEPSESRGSLLWRFFSNGLGLHRVDSSLGALKFRRFFSAGPEALGLLASPP
jgi:hypothetical protein